MRDQSGHLRIKGSGPSGRNRPSIAAISALLVVGLLVPGGADATPTPANLYDCKPRNPNAASPPPQPKLAPAIAANLAAAEESNDFERVCPDGEVPYPTGIASPVKVPPPAGREHAKAGAGISRYSSRRPPRSGRRAGANLSRSQFGSYWYSWAQGSQNYAATKKVNGLFVSQTNEQPYIDPYENVMGAHSLGQLWAINEKNEGSGCFSTAETGWSESVGQFGDPEPHLFIYAFDCGAGLGYAGAGLPWVQSSPVVFPNAVVSHNDYFHVYGARMDGNNWWIYYDGHWVGYIPHWAWSYHFPWVIKEAQAGGEVATPNWYTCSDMGYQGRFGGDPWAAMFNNVWYEYNNNTQQSAASLWSWSSDPSIYATGNWYSGMPGRQFRYGGPGFC